MAVFVDEYFWLVLGCLTSSLMTKYWAFMKRIVVPIWPAAMNGSVERVVRDLVKLEAGGFFRYTVSDLRQKWREKDYQNYS